MAGLEPGSNAKILDAAIKQVRKISSNVATMFISHDDKKIICLSSVPAEKVTKGLKANEWIQSISQIINGKGGGKAESAQGSGTNIAAIKQAIEVASEFAKMKLQ